MGRSFHMASQQGRNGSRTFFIGNLGKLGAGQAFNDGQVEAGRGLNAGGTDTDFLGGGLLGFI
jgi:hypothetical protein